MKRLDAVSERTLIGEKDALRNGRSPHGTDAAWPGSKTTATFSVGHTLKRPSVSSAGGAISEKRWAMSGPSTVDSV